MQVDSDLSNTVQGSEAVSILSRSEAPNTEQESDATAIPPGSEVAATQNPAIQPTQRIQTFLTSGGATAHLKATPRCLFCENQKSESLEYHNEHNVFDPEGLLKWQHWALDKVCGVMPAAMKEKSVLKILKEVRNEIQAAETEAQLAALSIDVWKPLLQRILC